MDTKIKAKAFERFAKAANTLANEELREWKDKGGKVVGHICCGVPVEVLMAAGILPFRMRATGSTGTELADAYYSNVNCSFTRHLFNQALRHEFDFLDGLVSLNSCDHARRIHDNWKRTLATPTFVEVLSMPMKAQEPQVEWFRAELENFRDAVSKHFGVEITQDRLQEAIKLQNETRRLIRQLYELRKAANPPITGAEALSVTVAAGSMPHERCRK